MNPSVPPSRVPHQDISKVPCDRKVSPRLAGDYPGLLKQMWATWSFEGWQGRGDIPGLDCRIIFPCLLVGERRQCHAFVMVVDDLDREINFCMVLRGRAVEDVVRGYLDVLQYLRIWRKLRITFRTPQAVGGTEVHPAYGGFILPERLVQGDGFLAVVHCRTGCQQQAG